MAAESSEAGASGGVRTEWPWLVAILVGGGLRAFRLLDQVPVDDEWHSIHRLLEQGYGEIALSFGLVDHCIPLTLYLKLATDTIGLSEPVLRLPSFAAGLAILVLCPLSVRRHLGRRGSHVFAWLLAISPLLVLYSRFSRPYEIAALLSFLAIALFERWWMGDRLRHAIGYAACAALAAWFLLAVLPFVVAPPLVLAGAIALGRAGPRARPVRRLAVPALSLAFFCALLLLPPLLNQPLALLAKLGAARPDARALYSALGFLLGVHPAWIGLAPAALALLGLRRLLGRAPVWCALALGSCALLGLGVFVSAPGYAWLGFVVARYLLPALPPLLVCVAAALDGLGPARSPLPALAATALCALLLWTGGVPATLADTRAWLPGRWVTRMEGRIPTARHVNHFYRRMGEAPPDTLTLVEAPWYYSLWNNLLPDYERVHRQRTLVGFTNGLCSRAHWGEYPPDAGIELDAFVHLSEPESLQRRGVDFVVFHRDLAAEMTRVVDPVDVAHTGQPAIEGCVEAYLSLGWPMVYGDAEIIVFEVPDAPQPHAAPKASGRPAPIGIE